ncbi:hypothetical protein L1286_24015, partial [Pseudoalteromonas sp. SMS1]|uniref:hypothetical protein n=1 Tax=Pseudoalteromonas sp. SMS1 TaxID=2908894 RepID=UPI001F2F0A61
MQIKVKNNTDLYAGRDTLTSANALWRKASEFAYDNENRVTEHKKYISDMRVHKVTVTEDGGIIRNGEVVKGVVGGAHEVRYPVDVYYGGNIESISKTEYNAAGEVIFTEEHTLLDSDLVNLIDDFVLSLDTSTLTSGSRQDQVSNPVYSSNIWGESALKVSARTQDYDYHSAGKV